MPADHTAEPVWRAAARVAGGYAVVATIWILASDAALHWVGLAGTPAQTLKGELFVLVTTGALALLVTREAWRRRRIQSARDLATDLGGVGLVEIDPQAGRARVTGSLARLLHWFDPPEWAMLSRIVHPDDLDELRAGLQGLLDGRAEDSGRLRLLRADGEVFWAWRHLRLGPADGGGTARVRGAFVDAQADAARQAELERARAEREALVRIIDRGPVVALSWTDAPGWPIAFASRNVAQWGYDSEALVDASQADGLRDLIHPRDLPGLDAALRVASDEGLERLQHECRLIGRTGEVLWVRLWLRVSRADEADDGAHYEGLLLDVTDRKHTEIELKLRTRAIDALAAGVTIVDMAAPDQPLVYANEGFLRLSGYPRDEVAGRNCRFLQGDDRDQPARSQIREALERGRELSVVLRNYRRDGTMFWNELTLAPIRDGAGAVSHFVGIQMDITDRVQDQERLRTVAYTDPVTSLNNRRGFEHEIERRLAAGDGGTAPQSYGVLVADLRGMQGINETRGTRVGDALLRELAAQTTRAVEAAGDEAVLGRTGGDEIALALFDLDADTLADRAAAFLRRFTRPVALPGTTIRAAACVGYVHARGTADVDQTVSQAELALYDAKRAGHNVVRRFTEDMAALAERRVRITDALRQAVEERQFELVYQPKVDLEDGRVLGAEALLRWRHPAFGLQSPATFIPIAEASGMIVDIGTWVLEEACRFVADCRAGGLACPPVAINVSASQCETGDIARQFPAIVDAAGLARDQIVLELTESVFGGDPAVRETLGALRRAGFPLALDDFGTGYSALAYLQAYDLAEIKIDRQFVAGVGQRGFDDAVIKMILAIAAELGSRSVAEGLETAADVRRVRALGCRIGQGFAFARPMSAADYRSLLEAGHPLQAEPGDAAATRATDDTP